MTKAAKSAFQDMKGTIEIQRKGLRVAFGEYGFQFMKLGYYEHKIVIDPTENWVAGASNVLTKESRRLNKALGL